MTTETRTVAQTLATLVQAAQNCESASPVNTDWRDRHIARIRQVVADFMPSGSGWDNGTTLDRDASNGACLVFSGGFHHMAECGMYDGWTDHRVTVRPAFYGFDVTVSGRNRNDIKEYLCDLFYDALSQVVAWDGSTDPDTGRFVAVRAAV